MPSKDGRGRRRAASAGLAVSGATSGMPEGDQFELTVPRGYAAGDELPVALPDGREMVVSVPDGLIEGDDFIALIPR